MGWGGSIRLAPTLQPHTHLGILHHHLASGPSLCWVQGPAVGLSLPH